jgi:CDP-paratose 2-epimerase
LLEHNLLGTINLLEYCKRYQAGLILISTSRVYSIAALAGLPVNQKNGAFVLDEDFMLNRNTIAGLTKQGIAETFSTSAPISLYGSTKLASEMLALEYGDVFNFPVWINRCGVIAGAGQFGKADQGIFTYWIHSYLYRQPLKYIGFGGHGFQVRDCLHPRDLLGLLLQQMAVPTFAGPRIFNLGGGQANAMSLAQLSGWCAAQFGAHDISQDLQVRPFDVPWFVMDSSLAKTIWGWEPQTPLESILQEITQHAELNPQWLAISTSS